MNHPRDTTREEVLRDLKYQRERGCDDGWVRRMDIGGGDGSNHSRILERLRRQGLVERRRRAGMCRPSYLYRITDQGVAAVVAELKALDDAIARRTEQRR